MCIDCQRAEMMTRLYSAMGALGDLPDFDNPYGTEVFQIIRYQSWGGYEPIRRRLFETLFGNEQSSAWINLRGEI